MKKQIEPWDEIAGLIALEKKAALADFHVREFVPVALPALRPEAAFAPHPPRRRAVLALAASLLLATGLASFWVLKGSWGISASAPATGDLLSGSFLYGGARSNEAVALEAGTRPASPFFTAWVKAGLERDAADVKPVDPKSPIERGDPEQVRRKLSRAIRENALGRMLTQLSEIHDKEA